MPSDQPSSAKTCFIISPIGELGSSDRKNADFFLNGIARPAVAEFDDFDTPLRADDVANPGMITDDIIIKIFEADLVIADISNLNPNVFYELGIRHAAGKPTIHCAIRGTPIPFDNKGYSTIFYDSTDWKSIEETRLKIKNSISTILTPGYKATNPVTHALSTKALLASADPNEKILAELVNRMERIENSTLKNRQPRPTGSLSIDGTNVVDLLDKSIQEEVERRNELRKIAKTIMNHFGRKFDEDDINFFASSNSSTENYSNIIELVKSGNFKKILSDIEPIPF